MSIRKFSYKAVTFAAATLAMTLSLQPAAQSDTVETSTVIMACGPLFSIDANADHKTAGERAKIVQRNLDNALVAAKTRTADCVKVGYMNHNPIVTLDNFYIVTADRNSAVRAGCTQLELAERWAASIRRCLSDTAMVDKYISMLTGNYKKEKQEVSQALTRTDIAVLPWGTNLPVTLQSDISVANAVLGMPLQAAINTDVPLGPNFHTYLPKGTIALGEMIDGRPFNPNKWCGGEAMTPYFYALRTPDGSEIPINGHILGGLNSWRAISINPLRPAADGRIATEKFAQITTQTVAANAGTISTTTKEESLETPIAFKGYVAGGWRGVREDSDVAEGFPRLMLSHKSGLYIPAGEKMTLQLGSTSTLSVNSAAPQNTSIAAATIQAGM